VQGAGVLGAGNTPQTVPPGLWETNLFDSTLDGDTNFLMTGTASSQKPATTTQLKQPTTTPSGVYCFNPPGSARCGDDAFGTDAWAANGATEHHTLLNMPGPNVQPK